LGKEELFLDIFTGAWGKISDIYTGGWGKLSKNHWMWLKDESLKN
jgi:hypothetical protein